MMSGGGGRTVTVRPVRKPVGFEIGHARLPIQVIGVEAGSHASELGIQTGWTLATLNGRDMIGDVRRPSSLP